MLRAARQQGSAASTRQTWNLVVFSIGGLKLAARTEEVGGVAPWGERIPVPSRTPYVDSLVKQDKDVLPVYDLASQLRREVEGDEALCLVARHIDGPMAIRIDSAVPSLHTIDATAIRPSAGQDVDWLGSFETEGARIAIVSLQRLGTHI